jgi:hypothetical protein
MASYKYKEETFFFLIIIQILFFNLSKKLSVGA